MEGGKIRTAVNAKDGQRYVWIPPGSVTMGCSQGDTECAADERPPHVERIANGFWLGQTEVTQAAYLRVTGGNPSAHKGDQLPMESLTWNHAANYCRAIDARLPTEVEWEYAARAGSPWARYGNLDEVAWHSGNSGGATHPVATKPANAFGLYDMLGNVWEYVADGYSGTADKILRGGSVFMDPRATRASNRMRKPPAGWANGRGFRCAGEDPGSRPSAPATAAVVPVRTVVPAVAGQRNPMVNPKDGQVYVWILPGSFTMGCSQGDTECDDNEKPPHPEEIADGFWLGQTEVTQAAYQRVIGDNPSHNQGDRLPVESVTWKDAMKYCGLIGGYLPSEAEWEYAARAHAGITPARYGSLDAVAWHVRQQWRDDSSCSRKAAERVRPIRHARQRVGVGAGCVLRDGIDSTRRSLGLRSSGRAGLTPFRSRSGGLDAHCGIPLCRRLAAAGKDAGPWTPRSGSAAVDSRCLPQRPWCLRACAVA